MKLAAKLTAFILAAMLLVFGVRGYQAARRQMANAETRTGGELTVHTCEEVVSPPAGMPATAGVYACLRVEDAGVGMTSEELRHAFEPFFTTKEVGSGTGLGLSVAHGIVRDHGGWITATSEVDKGSRFSMYLPSIHSRHKPPQAEISG